MNYKRRKYDQEDHGTMINWAHDRLDKIEPKLDALLRNLWLTAGALGTLIVMMNYPQLIKVISPDSARAETVHAGP